MSASGRVGFLCVVSALSLALTGCAMTVSSEGSGAAVAGLTVSGRVHGGQQPISGASVQLYAANMGAIKGASTPLLTTPAVTDKDGGFSFAFSCTDASFLYVVATGGNPGLTGAVDNQQIALMSLVGSCGMLAGDTSLSVNELTTVASVEALAPFMADYQDVGADPGNTAGLTGAYAGAAGMVDFETGTLQTATAGVTIPGPLLYTLADILAACVNTPGGTAGDGTVCGTLLADAGSGGATDTIGAMVRIVASPAANVSVLYGLVSTESPFVPALKVAPNDYSVPVQYALALPGGGAYTYGNSEIAIDTAQHIWVYTQATDASNVFQGTITIFDNNGKILHTIQPGTGGLYYAGELYPDPYGNMWVVNGNVTLSKFDGNGNPLTPSTGVSAPYLPPAQFGGGTSEYPLGISYFSIDPSGNVWTIGSGTSSNCYIEFDNALAQVPDTGNFCSQSVNQYTIAAATDGAGNAWFLGTNALGRSDAKGNFLNFGTTSNGCFNFNYDAASSDASLVENWTLNMVYDRVHHQLWGAADIDLGAIHDDGSPVFCDALGANLPVIPYFSTMSTNGFTVGYQFINSIALDGAGNLWFTSGGLGIAETKVPFSLTFTTASRLNEMDPTGKILTPTNANLNLAGLQSSGDALGEGMAIDAYGNIWLLTSTHNLMKISGLAVPKNYQ